MFAEREPDRTFDEMRGSCDEGRGLVCAFMSGALDLFSDIWFHVRECPVCQMDVRMGQVEVAASKAIPVELDVRPGVAVAGAQLVGTLAGTLTARKVEA